MILNSEKASEEIESACKNFIYGNEIQTADAEINGILNGIYSYLVLRKLDLLFA